MTQSEIIALLQKHIDDELLTAEEAAALQRLTTEELEKGVLELLSSRQQDYEYEGAKWDPILSKVYTSDKVSQGMANTETTTVVHRVHFLKKWWWAAAAIVVLIGAGIYLSDPGKQSAGSQQTVAAQQDVNPGLEGAILTLADGRKIVLDSAGNGLVAKEQGANIVLSNGQLVYDLTDNMSSEVVYNSISTPKGRQFRLLLPDSSVVWLNAGSSVRYPLVFQGSTRAIEAQGEVYIQVAKNHAKPFVVNVENKMEVAVLGTEFNINAYANEGKIAATLIQGAVKIKKISGEDAKEGVLLKPGEQALLAEAATGQQLEINREVDLNKVVAWKNGLFNFDQANLQEVLRQLERWYDIEVVYNKETAYPYIFQGQLQRNLTLLQILKGFKAMGIGYTLENKKLTILK